MANPKVTFKEYDDFIEIYVPLTSKGKFRCKTRDDFQEYGVSFAPKENPIPENAYIEWQIGYDRVEGDEGKETSLDNLTFTGANGKTKNPYELSEILFYLCKNDLVSKTEIEDIIDKINNMHNYLQDIYSINVSIEDNVAINNEDFFKSVITLPTFNKKNLSCDIIIQISIEKQQYATGVQPMLYINIPVHEFENSERIIGNNSKKEKFGILRINREKFEVIENVFICFGMCSASHHHDIVEILNLIKDNI